MAISWFPRNRRLRVDHLSVRLEEAHLLAVGERLEPDAVRFLHGRVPDRHLRHGERHFLLDDAALLATLGVGLLVLLHHIHALDDHAAVGEHLDYGAAPALVTAGEHDNLIAFANLFHQSTSGASEMIFMNCWLRSSRVTGPKMRVPIGSSLLVSNTAALPSKRISDPSGRRTPRLVRTTTASYTSPFFTLPRGMASLTLTLMTSPTF